ncbi:MAG: glycosyl hydrolase family 28-related protein, partial [Alphaproteobacteria bacterium]
GAGNTSGGSVSFDSAPANEVIVTLERKMPLERLTDYLEGGDFSASSINTELDFLIAAIQQVARQGDLTLKYSDHETPSSSDLPSKAQRAGKALGFNAQGEPIAVSLEGSMAAPDYTAQGTGAVTRTASDKFADFVSVKDFGAIGDGLNDDTIAIQNALSASDSVYIPCGSYLITSALELTSDKTLIGAGQGSLIKCQSNAFNAIEVNGKGVNIQNLGIESGDIAIKLHGKDSECTQNIVMAVQIRDANTGIQLDGYNDMTKPCYWNSFSDILVERPIVQGVHLTKSGAGDTPNANRFHKVRVYSKGASTSGSGFYIEHGALNNSFIDCEANVNGASAQSCFRAGAGSNKTMVLNFLAESSNSVPNIQLDSGSSETAIINLSAQSDGQAIYDLSGGNYDAINAGYPEKNRMRRSVITDLKATLMRYDTEFIQTAGTHSIDLSHSVHLVNATNGAIEIELPAASAAEAAEITVKKVDGTGNLVTITEDGGNGPDGKTLQLGGPNDYATLISNGANWYIKSSNRMSGNTRYAEASGTYDIDMAVDVYLISSWGGAVTARLPPANAVEAIGRIVTIKKTDPSANAVSVTEQGGNGPDQSSQTLSSRYDAITVIANGAEWYVLSRNP